MTIRIGKAVERPSNAPPLVLPVVAKSPTAYVNCGRGIEFTADFIVGMTLAQLLEWLKLCCSTRPFDTMDTGTYREIEWLPERLRLASGKEIGMDYVIQGGDALNLADPALPDQKEKNLLSNF